MLKKRERFEDDQLIESNKLAFMKTYMREALEANGRLKYYLDYEFPKKQLVLKKYWQRALNIFFKSGIKGFSCCWDDLLEFFTVEGTYPLGLSKIVADLIDSQEYILITSLTDLSKLKNHIDNLSNKKAQFSLWTAIKGIFGSSSAKIIDGAVLINIGLCCSSYMNTLNSLEEIFKNQKLYLEEDFLKALDSKTELKSKDQIYMINLLLMNKKLFKIKEKSNIFYFNEDWNESNSITFEASRTELLLTKNIQYLENRIQELQSSKEKILRECLKFKKENRKTECMSLLKRKNMIQNQIEGFSNKKFFYDDLLYKIESTHDDKVLKDILKGTNALFKKNEDSFDVLTENIDMAKEFNFQQNELNNILNDYNNDDDLKKMFEDLETENVVDDPFRQTPVHRRSAERLDSDEMDKKKSKRKILEE